jgi:hypothetical protein
MKLRDRIGVNISRRLKPEEALEWAAKSDLPHIDIQLDFGENALPLFDTKRCAGVRKLLDNKGCYTNGYPTLDGMVTGRDYLVERAREAGVKVD